VNERAAVVEGLTHGTLSMHRPGGAFCFCFVESDLSINNDHDDDDVYQGIDFYPGEAMVALVALVDVDDEDTKQ